MADIGLYIRMKFAEARKAKEEEERRKLAAQARFYGLVK